MRQTPRTQPHHIPTALVWRRIPPRAFAGGEGTIQPGQQLLHYRLVEKIGEGGMGVVWRAADTTLDREVAIKVLPPLLQNDAERMARFEREAKLLAALNHPNIAAVHGLHTAHVDAADVSFIAMELVPGDDLAQRLARGPLPVDEALAAARRIAQALESAHDGGTVHRDLKPANIKLAPDGTVKVLDFGLAKAFAPESASGSGSTSLSPTMTSAGSMAGMIMGTAGYMSPEQARGKPVDARTDVWAFGCVLYEMLTGRRLFEGETVSDILAEVLKTEPDWDALPADLPPAARRLLRRCLQRDPQRRLHHMGDARIEIEEALSEPTPSNVEPVRTVAPPTSGRERFAWLAVVVLLLATLAAVTLWPDAPPVRNTPVQSTLMPPVGWDFAPASPLAVSRDGKRVAFVATPRPDLEDLDATTSLWIRDLAAAEPRRLAEVAADSYPFWSPDGRSVGFFSNGKLNRIAAEGGPVVPICDASDGRGGTWSPSGTIVFQRGWTEGLMTVPAGGGTPEPLTTLDKGRFEVAHRWPYFLPDGRHFLFYVVSTTNPVTSEYSGIYLGSLDSDETTFLMQSASRGVYSGGHLLYRVGTTLMARRFDPSALALTGEPFPVATDITGGAISWGGANFGASDEGVIVHMRGSGSTDSVLVWRDREGNTLETVGEPAGYWEPSLSNDRMRLAVAVGMDTADIWIYDLTRDTRTRLTFDPAEDRCPLWSPDDRLIAFSSGREAEGEIWIRPTTGQGDAELVYTANTSVLLSDWSSDGRLIFFSFREASEQNWDVWTLDVDGREASPVLSGPFEQRGAKLSPDGGWLLFMSDESGNREVYVQRFPTADGRWMVSTDGGTRVVEGPTWSEDGSEIFYERGGTVFVVRVAPEAGGFSFGTPQALFGVRAKSVEGVSLAISDNGRRILTNELPPADPNKAGARLIQHWTAGFAEDR